MGAEWHVVRTDPRSESQAAQALSSVGKEIYFPKIKCPGETHGKAVKPLFPGYLFVKCDKEIDGMSWFGPGTKCVGWVNFDGYIPAISDEIMGDITALVDRINASRGLLESYKVGEIVQIESNGISGLAELVEAPNSAKTQAKVLLQFMGRMVEAKVPLKDIRSLISRNDSNGQRIRTTRGKGRPIPQHGLDSDKS